ncbi:hypothetical protein [Colwellia piezophila]|uniref:hypothetical protein n=1 Tax=Colwellia piezophila TaxID=211668 RepID=UPI0003799DA4|nr:hypothetical protein [Colwellia piezophila]
MKISHDVARTEMLQYFNVRAEDKKINNAEDYEKHLYKVIVQHLNLFTGGNWGEFEYLTWMAAIEYYEIKNYLPRKLSQLRFELGGEKDKTVNRIDSNKDIIVLKYKLPTEYKVLSSYCEYEFHLYKVMYERFSRNKEVDIEYDNLYWGGLVKLYELENNLPLIFAEIIELERYRGIRRLRQVVS